MKNPLLLLAALYLAMLNPALADPAEQSIKHLDLPDITTFAEADAVFKSTTAELRSKTNLSAQALNDIHIITYSLEKAVAYFVENTEGEAKDTATEMAEVVERVHIASENGRAEDTGTHLAQYFELAGGFSDLLGDNK